MTFERDSTDHNQGIQDGPILLVRWPEGVEQRMDLPHREFIIGRSPECDLAVAREIRAVSRRHLAIGYQNGVHFAIDLNSANGVWLNGDRLAGSAPLQDGDELSIGDSRQGGVVQMRYLQGARDALQSPGAGETDAFNEEENDNLISGRLPYLIVRWPGGRSTSVEFSQEGFLVGRDPQADLSVPDTYGFVSRQHFRIDRQGNEFTVIDLGSHSGTRLNNIPLPASEPAHLADGSVLRIGDEGFGVSIGFLFQNPFEKLPVGESWLPDVSPTQLWQQEIVTIGRSKENDLVLSSPRVSRRHAEIRQTGERFTIFDLQSSNGTFLNGELVESEQLFDGDLINIGGHLLLFQAGKVSAYVSKGMRLDVIALAKDIGRGNNARRILHELDMTILPGEFVAVVGASGAGKTTLIRALTGIDPGEGQVRINGRNFYKEYERFRGEFGYVPQFDILHSTLTVDKALGYAAQLRLPSDLTAAERIQRIETVLETVSMADPVVRSTRIGNLSGGQRKRVSIAAELLADPRLIYLDEATSGLDPGLEKKLMHTLRQLADEGRTVVLITHATANIVQADHVMFLSQGRLIFFGPSGDALSFFGVEDFADIYEQIEKNGAGWEHTFIQGNPRFHQRYVEERKQSLKALPSHPVRPKRGLVESYLRQLFVLTRRAYSVISSDWITLSLLLLLFPLTAMLQLVIATPDVLVGNAAILADPAAAARTAAEAYIPFPSMNTFVFVMGLEAVLVGLVVPSNELIKERTIFLRERMINLSVFSYLISKWGVFTLFSIVQVLLYLLVLSFGVDYPQEGVYLPGILELFVTLCLTMLAGNGLGLLISAISRNTEMAIYLLTLMLFFQFFFAGTVFDLREKTAEPLSYLTATRWSLTAIGVTTDIEGITESTLLCNQFDDPTTVTVESNLRCFHYPEATEDLLLPYDEPLLLVSWLILAGMMVGGYSLTGLVLAKQK